MILKPLKRCVDNTNYSLWLKLFLGNSNNNSFKYILLHTAYFNVCNN
jgi:hypothetical protein